MTDEELLTKAIEKLRTLEAHRTNVPDRLRTMTVDRLTKRSVRDAVVIYFEDENTDGRIEVFMDRESGEMIAANYLPANVPKTI